MFEDSASDTSEWTLTNASASEEEYESASSAESTRDSRKKAKRRAKRGKPRDKARTEQTVENNPCKYCKRYGRHSRHPHLDTDKCFWNKKKYKGWRPQYVCEKMGIPFRSKKKFAIVDDETSDEESK